LNVINYRISQREQTGKPSEKNDFLDIYITALLSEENKNYPEEEKITIDEIIDQFITFFFAGMDTTGHLTAMCLYNLA
jgi:cytochrome P450